MPLRTLQQYLHSVPQADYPFQSRIHPLHSYTFPDISAFIKRDDELGFGISGSKIRKYRTLIPWLIEHRYEEVAVIGSASSNHVLGLSQLLIENQIKPTLFLRGNKSYSLQGNCLLSLLLVQGTDVHWISKSNWKNVETTAEHYASSSSRNVFVLPEGGSVPPSFDGSLTLALDIVENETQSGASFDHIFIESGTGLMACALILGLHLLHHPAHVHTILLAGDPQTFLRRLRQYHHHFCAQMPTSMIFPKNFSLHTPIKTGKFGETPPSTFSFIRQTAVQEGFLTDPVYSAKLLIEGRDILSKGLLKGRVLFIHSGGGTTLLSFQDQLKKTISI